jgi:Na+-translocating ferredoxin:NAD+ oxidoreductase RNF subunit RnfB
METFYIAVISVTVIGAACAAVLCVASKFMHVKVDERLAQLQAAMPGVNCGVCGYPGCSGYAVALLSCEGVRANLCTPGGPEVLAQISAILGVEAESIVQKIAIVDCLGDSGTQQKKMDYKGVQSCEAAKQLFGGEGSCAFGCLGYGDCQAICPKDAICMENALARVDPRLCTGCTLCVKACPKNLISMESAGAPVFVLCKNIEKGAVVRKKCLKGCIGCGKCVRECPETAVAIEDNLAKIDYTKCSGCGHCVEVCVAKCIQPVIKKM